MQGTAEFMVAVVIVVVVKVVVVVFVFVVIVVAAVVFVVVVVFADIINSLFIQKYIHSVRNSASTEGYMK